MNKYLLLMALNLSTFASFGNFGGLGGFGGPDLDHDPRYRHRPQDNKVDVAKCEIKRNAQVFHLNKRNYSLDELFALVATTQKGKSVIDQLMPLLDQGKLKISNLTSFERQRRGLGSRTSALFDFTTTVPTIYIGFEDELGLVAHFFVHEATHALDKLIPQEYEVDMIYYNAFKHFQKLFGLDVGPMKELSEYETQKMYEIYEIKEKNRNQHIYRAERYAFDEQGIFTNEVLKVSDCYEDYVQEHVEKNKLKLYRDTPDEHIINAYGINTDYLK
ncbi:hypothetical protein [Halobacteriovorax sp.]|uniref:hypothetical protein n=1 Tax=Halobacteriovorax sp. TaxID=2020862 RepID=UPI003AF2F850